MAQTAREMITEAYVISGIVADQLQTISGYQLTSGLHMLNSLLELKAIDAKHISYYRELSIPLVIGQEIYNVPGLISIETGTFNIGTVRFAMIEVGREEYFGTPRVDGIKALPYQYHLERLKGGANIYIQFTSNQAYTMKIWGKFFLAEVTLDQDLSTTLDHYYREYLTFDLARQICVRNGVTMQPMTLQYLKSLEAKITDVSPTDYTIRKVSTLNGSSGQTGDVYLQANLALGWEP
jgi:hypothetical protein